LPQEESPSSHFIVGNAFCKRPADPGLREIRQADQALESLWLTSHHGLFSTDVATIGAVRFLLVSIVLLIVYVTLYPFHFDFDRTFLSPAWILFHSWPVPFDRFAMRDAVTNVFLYMPLGFTATLAFGRRWWAAILLGVGLSASLEMLQVYDFTRTCSLADLAFNTIGVTLGAIVALAAPSRILRLTIGRAQTGPAIVAGCWIGFLFYPFIPLLSRGHLHASWSRFIAAHLSFPEILAGGAEWFAAALLVEAVIGRVRTVWLALALLALPIRLLLADRNLTPAETGGGILALLLWAAIPRGRRELVAIPLLAFGILLREFWPFHFTSEPASFSWIPFAATISSDPLPGAVVILRKAFDYGAMVWLARGIGLARAGIAVSAILFLAEWAQRYLPGRQPEITDSVLTLIMAGILAWSGRR
jgi:VanZ family protein